MIKRAHYLLLVASFILLHVCTMAIAEPILEYDMKAAYLYNFAVLTEWPTKNNHELNLCILGKDNFNGALERLAKKSANGSQVKLTYLASIQFASACNVLFIDKTDTHASSANIQSIAHLPILTVTDNPALFSAGAMIGLKIENNKLAFDINYSAAKNANLNMSSKLLRVADTVK